MKKQDWEKHQYGKNHTYDLTRMKWPPNLFESSSVLCECSPGTMVETVLHDSGDRSTVGSLGAEGSARMLMTYPLLSKTLQLTPLEGGSWGVRTNTFISIEDLTLVGEEVQVIGPLRGVGYSREEGWRGEVRFDEAPYSRGELPVGTVG